MTRFYGWAGTILKVDLTSGEIEKEPLSPDFARKYLGASGFNSARLFELVRPEVDALSPENVLMFGAGPLSGTLAPGSARLTVTAKSPETDIFGDSNMGGSFAAELKFAGYDQVIVTGRAKNPVYLWIDDDEVELRDASHLWGESTWQTARKIREDEADIDVQVVCIGQAGENLVRFSTVMEPPRHAAGRVGMGAVMGSKVLKAVAVRGSKDIAIARPEEFALACREMRQDVISHSPGYVLDKTLGSPGFMELDIQHGTSGSRNFQRNLFSKDWEAISGKTFARDFSVAHRGCTACFVACSHYHSVRSGEFAGVYGGGPEFGLTNMGLRCEIDNMPALLKMNQLLNQYGIGCTSVQQMLAWAMECYQRGILTGEDFHGTPLSFGDYNACVEMIPKIANREGFGNILAEGENRAPRLVGKGSEKFMYHVKGQSISTTDPRADMQYGLMCLTSTRGADHLKGQPRAMFMLRESAVLKKLWRDPEALVKSNPKGKGLVVKMCEDMCAAANASGICYRTCGSLQLLARVLSTATGVDFTEESVLESGERVFNLQKAFNSRQGLTRVDDNFSVPDKFTQAPIEEGPRRGNVFARDTMLDEYYKTRGWDRETGLQTKKKLDELGLEDVAGKLKEMGAVR